MVGNHIISFQGIHSNYRCIDEVMLVLIEVPELKVKPGTSKKSSFNLSPEGKFISNK